MGQALVRLHGDSHLVCKVEADQRDVLYGSGIFKLGPQHNLEGWVGLGDGGRLCPEEDMCIRMADSVEAT